MIDSSTDNIPEIEVHSTYIKVHASKDGILFPRYKGVDIRKILNKLKLFNYNQKGVLLSVINYYGYDEEDNTFVLPRYALNLLVKKFDEYKGNDSDFNYHLTFIPPIKPKTIAIAMQSSWHDRDEHEAALAHLNKPNEPMLANNLQTGKGKTYVAIKTAVLKHHVTLIVCDTLCEQWCANLLEKTTIKEDEIYLLQGAPSVVKLVTQRKTYKNKIKVIVCSLPTLKQYIERNNHPYTEILPYKKMLAYFGVGTKITDEFHLNFQSIVNVDLVSDIESNIYLSATPKRSNRQELEIFNTIFPKNIIGGQNEYDKYVDVYMVFYQMEAWHNGDRGLTTSFGYSHNRYEQKFVHDSRCYNTFIRVLKHTVKQYYLDGAPSGGGSKCLIFVNTVLLANKVRDELVKYLHNHDVRTYLSADSVDNLSEADVIIGTTKSTGVGKDIAKLSTVINTISLASEPLLMQLLGRLRKLPNVKTRYIDLVNESVPSQIRHAKTKRRVYSPCAANYKEYHI